jgi:hypothetical protein
VKFAQRSDVGAAGDGSSDPHVAILSKRSKRSSARAQHERRPGTRPNSACIKPQTSMPRDELLSFSPRPHKKTGRTARETPCATYGAFFITASVGNVLQEHCEVLATGAIARWNGQPDEFSEGTACQRSVNHEPRLLPQNNKLTRVFQPIPMHL